MIFIKKTTVEKLADYFNQHGYKAENEEQAYILTDATEIKAVCSYIEKKNYILIKRIICPSENKVFVDAAVRTVLNGKFDEGFIYALISAENEFIKNTLIQMTQFKSVLPDYAYSVGILFDKSDIDDKCLFVDIFKLFMHHKCKGQ